MSIITGVDDGGSFSSGNNTGGEEVHQQQKQKQELLKHFHGVSNSMSSSTTFSNGSTTQQLQPPPLKKKRNQPGTPDPSAEVIALSPHSLLATNRFVCEICNKGFQRDQNLQLHRRGHNLPWKLRQRSSTDIIRKRVYVCPEPSCVHHNPARALGDLTGIKKHFCRKHGEKKWKCERCSKKYAVQSDWKAHSKICGTREYKCDCGTIFSRRDSFITHRAFCDAIAEENNKVKANQQQGLMSNIGPILQGQICKELMSSIPIGTNPSTETSHQFNHSDIKTPLTLPHQELLQVPHKPLNMNGSMFSRSLSANSSTICEGNEHHFASSGHLSATALLQKAAEMGATVSTNSVSSPATMNMQKMRYITSMAPASTYTNNQSTSQVMAMEYAAAAAGTFANQQFMKKNAQELASPSPQFFNGNGNHGGIGLFDGVFDENSGFMNKMEENNGKSKSVLHGGGDSNIVNGVGSNGSENVMTLDFLGINGRARSAAGNFHEQKQIHLQKKQQDMGFGGLVGHLNMQGLNQFEQHTGMEKNLWEV
ncbi:protein indeterminate-domain 7 [Ziziphus jujuba]|uniref:Protein indeterminate-domain 7 n=2 Tax=Ziziphus jujuba TaxID=326968 RepID=A0A6P3ZC01_ZIZJJ|nr:protein indeterminate-domain 7 [Ziziphus jujuba]KAH7543051.1 hypothetical protein FEM48_Zijuj02G0142200 [Ziziphus jujuba var. spinosa]